MPEKGPVLRDLLAAIAAAPDVLQLEDAAQRAWKSFPAEQTSDRILKAVRARGIALAASSPYSQLIPVMGSRRRITLCGQSYSVGFGGNGAGERYCWHYATEWMRQRLVEAGVDDATASHVIDWWRSGFPHRALRAVEAAPPRSW